MANAASRSATELVNLRMSLQGKPHEPFGMGNVEPTARSVARRIGRETGLGLVALEGHRVAVRRNPTASQLAASLFHMTAGRSIGSRVSSVMVVEALSLPSK